MQDELAVADIIEPFARPSSRYRASMRDINACMKFLAVHFDRVMWDICGDSGRLQHNINACDEKIAKLKCKTTDKKQKLL